MKNSIDVQLVVCGTSERPDGAYHRVAIRFIADSDWTYLFVTDETLKNLENRLSIKATQA